MMQSLKMSIFDSELIINANFKNMDYVIQIFI